MSLGRTYVPPTLYTVAVVRHYCFIIIAGDLLFQILFDHQLAGVIPLGLTIYAWLTLLLQTLY